MAYASSCHNYPCSKDANYTAFLAAIATVNTTSIEAQGHDAVYAFFMNVYNALAIKMIIDHPCSTSLLKYAKFNCLLLDTRHSVLEDW